MNNQELRTNLIGVVKESQIKLGYTKTPIRLYFPLESLNRLLDTALSVTEMEQALADFSASVQNELGALQISREGERFCILIPEEGVQYVHEHVETSGFLEELIACMQQPHCTIDDIAAVFRRYSDHVIIEKQETHTEEFHYLLYFADGQPDAYRYCIHEEMGRLIYHRFTEKEFDAFGFE